MTVYIEQRIGRVNAYSSEQSVTSSKSKAIQDDPQSPNVPKRPGPGPVGVILCLIGLAVVGFGLYKAHEGALAQQVVDEKHRQEQRAASEHDEHLRLVQIAEEKAVLVRNADRDTLRKAVVSCQNQISDLLGKSPFGLSFPHYAPTKLREFAGIGAAMRTPLGFPSAALDDYSFDQIDWNLNLITQKTYPSTSITFAVEGARDGFKVRQYAAVYRCEMDGLDVGKPRQTENYNLD
ncbi:hypothetical protein AB4Z52_29450 [Rhizobium sp. 2YAF20]|uniref:hypothetical protein n=1 Tax=Rhizobium sp. 2YAF20 TaxID=3233027 RepID=UPI003F9A41AE